VISGGQLRPKAEKQCSPSFGKRSHIKGKYLAIRKASIAKVANQFAFSCRGYNEMLVGIPDPHVDKNDFGPKPNVTVFEWLNRIPEPLHARKARCAARWSLSFHHLHDSMNVIILEYENETAIDEGQETRVRKTKTDKTQDHPVC